MTSLPARAIHARSYPPSPPAKGTRSLTSPRRQKSPSQTPPFNCAHSLRRSMQVVFRGEFRIMPTDLDLDAEDARRADLARRFAPALRALHLARRLGASGASSLSTAGSGAAQAGWRRGGSGGGGLLQLPRQAALRRAGHQAEGCTARAKVSRAVLPGTEVAPGMKRSPKADAPAPKRTSGRTTSAPPPPPAEEPPPPPPPPPPPAEAEEPVRRPGPIGATTTADVRVLPGQAQVRRPGIRGRAACSSRRARLRRRRRRHAPPPPRRRCSRLGRRRRAAPRHYLGDGHRPVDESSPAKFNAALGDASPFVAGGVTPSALMLQTPELELLAGGISPSRRLRI